MAAFSAAGLLLAALAAALLDRAYLPGGMGAELRRGNVAAGITSAAHRLACGIIAGHCLYGADLATLAVGAAFLALGVATLLVFQVLHRKLTRYADDEEIRGGNAAAALSNGGLGVALAIIIGHAADGSFTGWGRFAARLCHRPGAGGGAVPGPAAAGEAPDPGAAAQPARAPAGPGDRRAAQHRRGRGRGADLRGNGVAGHRRGMNPQPVSTGSDYDRLAEALLATGLVTDPWVDGQPRFASQPLALPAAQLRVLYRAAERLAAATHEAAMQVAADPALLDDFFALTPVQKLLWASSAPLWHGIARADLFLMDGPDGPRGYLLRAERRHAQRAAGSGAAGSGHRRAGRSRSQPRAGGALR